MSSSPAGDPRRVKELFLEALERPPQERLAHLELAAAGDADLLWRVLELLEAHERAEGLLARELGLPRRPWARGERPRE